MAYKKNAFEDVLSRIGKSVVRPITETISKAIAGPVISPIASDQQFHPIPAQSDLGQVNAMTPVQQYQHWSGAVEKTPNLTQQQKNNVLLDPTYRPAGAEANFGVFPYPSARPNPSPTPIPGIGVPNQTADSTKFLENVVYPLAQRYGIHPAIAAGQFGVEGRLGGVGAKRNNFYNIGNTDALVKEAYETKDFSKLPNYPSPEYGVERYMQFISGLLPDDRYPSLQVKKMFKNAMAQYRNDPEAFLRAVGAVYASTGNAYAEHVMSTPEYQAAFEIAKTVLSQNNPRKVLR